jgi:hypothetical protein
VNSSTQDKAWIMPGTGLAFSVLVAFLAPLYERSFGTALPSFTHAFLGAYPLWIAFCTAALAITALAEQFPPFARWRALWSGLDIALATVSVLIIASGLIALFLPLLVSPLAANL